MSKNDGGPAFPVAGMEGVAPPYDGMSLRDWFAGQALAAMAGCSEPHSVAACCYVHADEMLKAREKGGDS